MQDLISKCWKNLPGERPTFDKICEEMLKDFSFLGEDVDEEEANEYLAMIEERTVDVPKKASDLKDHIKNLENERNKFNDRISELQVLRENLQKKSKKLRKKETICNNTTRHLLIRSVQSFQTKTMTNALPLLKETPILVTTSVESSQTTQTTKFQVLFAKMENYQVLY